MQGSCTPGEFLTIMKPSEAGKTTMLNILADLTLQIYSFKEQYMLII